MDGVSHKHLWLTRELSVAAKSILPSNSTALNRVSWRRDSSPICLDLRAALSLSQLSPMTSRVRHRFTPNDVLQRQLLDSQGSAWAMRDHNHVTVVSCGIHGRQLTHQRL